MYFIFACMILGIFFRYFEIYPDKVNAYRSGISSALRKTTTNKDAQYSQDYIRNNINGIDKELSNHWLRVIRHYIRFPLANGYGSHQLSLLAATILTSGGGPVMELGCGYFSTILLHQIVVVEQKRYLLSTDTDRQWLSKFDTNMSSSLHEFRHVNMTSEWDNIGTNHPRWSIAFIDHKPGDRRVIDVIRLANITDVVILHDTETSSYNYEIGLVLYQYKYRYKYFPTNTDVLSKYNGTLFHNIQHLLELTLEMKLPKIGS
ncbi:unnamed protein product [Rotaria sp. Silwood2]|nr:unnamed protein product [Rotaria sp. Silwood2]CAF3000646.1 unnamed protein product [Rotaria sp. Silwood2]CAF3099458.1 unnamed protein product [Rotaria sp. Silwood2]CAF3414321.1 unnamed protein product [Rotaria sp. Silwood2]CAF3907522.1 unnamed protein product [Rotaria sp. Silwood2]